MTTATLSNRVSFREKLSLKILDILIPVYFVMRRNRQAWTTTVDDMHQMPAGSLGNDVANFLTSHNLKLMPKAEWHDVYHVLFGYETNMRDETCIQFVPVGNGRWSVPYIACVLVTAIVWPEYWGYYYEGFKRGKAAAKFHDWNFEPLLRMPTQQIRRMIFGPKDYGQQMHEGEFFI